ncbi:MAG: isoprenyl transferase [Desulfobulbaceae bacterium]|nr:isoprenyl transferase [Desulfobulbaceae bacterium]
MQFPQELDSDNIPTHVAIIMDGNGRWAQQRGMPRPMGHKVGVESVQSVVRAARVIGVKVLTLYAFSTENWKRPPLEVNALMGLLKTFLLRELETMVSNNVSLRCIGQKDRLPKEVRETLDRVIAETADNDGLIFNLALNYGSRVEIIDAVREVARKCETGELQSDAISEDLFAEHLYTSGLPDPDLLIRTGGEARLSNFLLWQASYSEICFVDTLWPDFREEHLVEAIRVYQGRQRRFGMTGDQVQQP